MLLVTVSYLPPVGNPDNPAHNEVVEKYIEDGMQDTGAVNIVAGMILDYRAFDTFGESNVLFIATVLVMLMMRDDKRKSGVDSADMQHEERFDTIFQQVTYILFPLIMIYGIYVVVNGHLSPGGGFSGGAIMGAGLILYLNAFGIEKISRFFTANTHKYVCFAALSFYCLAKSYSFFTGANHLPSIITTGVPGKIISAGLILPLNICVGFVVACTMYSFYTLFRKGGY
jgi:multicomponent Na+:H+ antiporter subunit B